MLREETQKFNKKTISYKEIKNHVNELLKIFDIHFETSYISCWHFNNSESSAMWGLYIKGKEGIAISTDAKSFKNSFSNIKKMYTSVKLDIKICHCWC
jgi:hypothetical protein